ncbi:MAG: DUF1015 domain-containing protein [Actinobacteria bacterium]|nr:DUF1015 domain-containing protein [Actinomycetota bacterium]
MARIKPFCGVRYNTDLINIQDVVTQPYDKIDENMRRSYHHKSPYNIVRLILGYDIPEHGQVSDKYERAKNLFTTWISSCILNRDSEPSFYVYEQEFELRGEYFCRLSLIADVQLVEFSKGVILPHENTLSKPKEDRLKLLEKTKANLELVFMLYQDKNMEIVRMLKSCIKSRRPLFDIIDDLGIRNRLWRLSDAELIEQITAWFGDKKLYIADGHHRYESSLIYRDKMRKLDADGAEKSYDFIMSALVSIDDPALRILPTHRAVFEIEDFSIEDFLSRVSVNFDIINCGQSLESVLNYMDIPGTQDWKSSTVSIGYFYEGNGDFFVFKLKEGRKPEELIDGSYSIEWKNLDVAILHKLILDEILGITEEKLRSESNVKYVRELSELYDMVAEGEAQMAFVMNPTRTEQVRTICERGEKMPQKSTDFYPKMLTGLVINPLI